MEDAKIYAYNNEITAGAMVLARGCKKVDGRIVRRKFNRVQWLFNKKWTTFAQVATFNGYAIISWNKGIDYRPATNALAVFTFEKQKDDRILITLTTN